MNNSEQTNRELSYIKSILDSKQVDFHAKIESLIASQQNELKLAVEKERDALSSHYEIKMASLNESLAKSVDAYRTLEQEFLKQITRNLQS